MSEVIKEIRAKISNCEQDHNQQNTFANARTLQYQLIFEYKTKLLAVLSEQFFNETEPTVNDMQILLEDNWALVKGTMLAYTAMPQDSLTLLLCDIAEWVAQKTDSNPVQVLMPSIVAVDSLYKPDAPILGGEDYPLSWVLKNHILSECGQYLLPASLLLEIEANTDHAKIFNPYWNNQTDIGIYLTSGELARLFKHSGAATALSNAHDNLRLKLDDQNSLLGHLSALVRSLRLNDAHEGIGEDENAGGGAYPAMIEFYQYYFYLPEAEKNRIPNALKEELDLLYIFVTDQSKNVDATKNIQTCIGTRRENIQKAMQGHEEVLARIALDHKDQENLISTAMEELAQAQKYLKASFENEEQPYEGQDTDLQITPALLNNLEVEFYLPENQQDLIFLLRSLSNESFTQFFNGTALAAQVMNKIDDLESLVMLLNGLSAEKISVLLNNSNQGSRFINSVEVLGNVLDMFDADKCRAICEGFQDHLSNLIKQGADVVRVLSKLHNTAQRDAVYDSLKNRLFQILANKKGINDDAKVLPDIIKRPNQLVEILKYFSPDQYAMLLAYFNADDLQKIFIVGNTLGRALNHLSAEQSEAFCTALEDRLPLLIRSGSQLGEMLQHLKPDLCASILHKYAQQKRKQKEKEKSPQQKQIGRIFLRDWLGGVLKYLDSDQCIKALKALKNHIPDAIRSGYELGVTLKNLDAEQSAHLFAVLKDHLPTVIKDAEQLGIALQPLDAVRCAAVCEALKDHLPNLIQDAQQFGEAFKNLNPDQSAQLFAALKDRLLNTIIGDGDDFNVLLRGLGDEQRTEVYDSMKEELPTLIRKNWRQFHLVLQHLDSSQRTEVYDRVGEELPEKLYDGRQLYNAVRYLTKDQRAEVLDNFRDRLPELVKNLSDLGAVCRLLNSRQQQSELYQGVKAVYWDRLVKNDMTFESVNTALRSLHPELCEKLCKDLIGQLRVHYVRNPQNIYTLLRDLNRERATAVCKALESYFQQVVNDKHDFVSVINGLLQGLNNRSERSVNNFQAQCEMFAVSLGRKKLKAILSEKGIHLHNPHVRAALLAAYKTLRENEPKAYFYGKAFSFFQHSRQEKLTAVNHLIQGESTDAASEQGLLGTINLATR